MNFMENNQFRTADAVKGFIFALTLLETPVFFAVYAITGRTYAGSENSPAYIIYMVALLAVQIFYLFQKRRIRRSALMWLTIPVIFVAVAWLFAVIYREPLNMSYIRSAVLWQYTGILLAINISSRNVEKYIVGSLAILMALITAGSVIIVLVPFLRGTPLYTAAGYSLVGSTFQTQSYFTALSVGVNLFFFAAAPKFKLAKVAAFLLLGIQFICAILYAGRGGMILALMYVVAFYIFTSRRRGKAKNKLFTALVYLAAFAILFLILGQIVESSPVLQRRFGRIFSYIGSGGIDLAQTSHRDIVYSRALSYIAKSPVLGYGLLGYLYLDGLNRYPHNILLELLIEGGAVYLLFWGGVVLSCFRKAKRIVSEEKYKIFLVMAIFSIIKLMFSGSYCFEMSFWFAIVFAFTCSREVASE